ncbi:MAG: hypothetical protein ABI720_08840 [Actinomycetes bacterium]
MAQRVADRAVRRGNVGAALLLTVTLLGLLVVQAPASAAESDESALAERYSPHVRLVKQLDECGVGEPYAPSDVDVLLSNDSVGLRGPWATDDLVDVGPTAEDLAEGLPGYFLDFPGEPLNPGCTYEEWADDTWAGRQATTYAHVVTQEDRPGQLAVQYWFFYPFNDFNNRHEGDWERIQVEFDVGDVASALETKPTRVVYSAHEGSVQALWVDSKLTRVEDTHPVIYVGAGSHASYYGPGLFLLRSASQGLGCDVTLDTADPLPLAVKTISSIRSEAIDEFPWIAYEGRWGQRNETSFYNGVAGPNTKGQWTKPFTWSDDAATQSFSVPGGQVYGVKTTDFFCSAVEKGSFTLLRLTADPAPVLIAGFLLFGAVVWLARKASRGDSYGDPSRPRTFGSTVSAAWATYSSHRRLFFGISMWVAIIAVVSSVIQQLVAGEPISATSAPQATPLGGSAVLIGGGMLGVVILLSQSATAHAWAGIRSGQQITARQSYHRALPRVPALVGTALLAAAAYIVVGLSVYLAPAALLLAVVWALVVPVVQLEGASGAGALVRSWRLVRHQLLKVAGLLVFGALLVALVSGLSGTLLLIAFQVPFVIVNVVPGVIAALLTPFVTLMLLYAFLDGQSREVDEVEATEAGSMSDGANLTEGS